MSQHLNEHRIDELLSRALRARGVAEPRSGLEERVIASMRVQAQTPVGRNWKWAWAAGFAAAATAVIVIALAATKSVPTHAPTESAENVRPKTSSPLNVPPISVKRNLSPLRGARRLLRHSEQPAPVRLAVFPAPAPLSADEQSLVAWLQEAPVAIVPASAAESETKLAAGKDPLALGEDSQPKFTELAFLYPQDHTRERSQPGGTR